MQDMAWLELSAFLMTGALSGLIAGLLGLGGGVVIVPALIWILSQGAAPAALVPHIAVGTSLATIVATASASVLAHQRRAAIRWRIVADLALWILIGAWLGSALAGALSGEWLRRIFAVFLLYVGVHTLTKSAPTGIAEAVKRPRRWLAGITIGSFSALVGIGGGTLTVPYLTRSGLDIRRAVATSSACGLWIALAGALGFVVTGWNRAGLPAGATGFVYWPAVLGLALASVPMAPVGAELAHRLPMRWVERMFGAVVISVGLALLVRSF